MAAYLLVVQAALTGMTLGAQAAAPHSFLEILCAPSGEPADGTHLPSKPHQAPSCCVAGCAMLGGGLAPAPEISDAAPRIDARIADRPIVSLDPPSTAPERSSRSPRAPPATA